MPISMKKNLQKTASTIKLHLVLLLFLSPFSLVWSQKNLIREISTQDKSFKTQNTTRIYNQYKNNPLVKEVFFIKLDVESFNDGSVKIEFMGNSSVAKKTRNELHVAEKGFSWFGQLSDGTGIFFTVIDNQVASKFYMGSTPCLIIPFNNDTHLLITYNADIDNAICGTPEEKNDSQLNEKNNLENNLSAISDDNCTMRVLLVVTAQAEPEIPMSLELASRMLQDETNLAYEQSLINLRMEVARVVRTNYVETINFSNATAYGSSSSYPDDLLNLSSGSGLLNNIPVLRNQYSADVVAMVRSASTSFSQGFYGIAFGIPRGSSAINADNGFALVSTEFIIGGRFTFAHEIGHIQGARHDNDNSSPNYARGFIFSSSGVSNRTIMAVGGNCNPSTGCRVQFFSNPSVTLNGLPIGVTNERDNARRINETSSQILANRITNTNLSLLAETFENGILARHLATQTISTNNNPVIALPNSRVSMRAGYSITLLPGFTASTGCTFSAYISTCSFQSSSSFFRQSGIVPENNTNVQNNFDLIEEGTHYHAYPVPVDNILNITHPKTSKVLFLYDLMGKLLIQKETDASGSTTLELKGLLPGVYLLQIDSRKTIRIIVD